MGRPKGDREEWLKLVKRWVDSGLSAREFGNEMGVKASTLLYWKKTLNKEGLLPADMLAAPRPKPTKQRASTVASIKPRLATVAPVHEAPVENRDPYEGRFELCVGTTTIWVPRDFDEATLRRLLVIAREAEADQGDEPQDDDEAPAEDDQDEHEAEAAE